MRNPYDHLSTPNGCEEGCSACAWISRNKPHHMYQVLLDAVRYALAFSDEKIAPVIKDKLREALKQTEVH